MSGKYKVMHLVHLKANIIQEKRKSFFKVLPKVNFK